MPSIEREIDSQPEIWRRSVALARAKGGEFPEGGERIALIGCGTSHFAAQSIAVLRESRGLGESDAFAASEFPSGRRYDRVIAISRSGTTTEVVRALESLDGGPSLAISAVPDSPVTRAAQKSIELEFADEEVLVQTRFATAVLTLAMAWLGLEEEVVAAAKRVERAQRADPSLDPVGFEHFVFLGTGSAVGLANEAALKMRESAGVWAESYPAMEFRHGPVSAANGSTLVWPLGVVDSGVLDTAVAAGATVAESDANPLVELVNIQRAAVTVARARGRDPGFPKHLTRSVVLT